MHVLNSREKVVDSCVRVDWGGCELSGVGSGGSERDEQRKKKNGRFDDS